MPLDDRLRLAPRRLAAAGGVLLLLQASLVLARLPSQDPGVPRIAGGPQPAPAAVGPQRPPAPPTSTALGAPTTTPRPAPPGPPPDTDANGGHPTPPRPTASAPAPAAPARAPQPDDPARERFEQRFPAHAQATQRPGDPSTTRWAVVVGINQHAGRTRDNLGSRQDAEELAAYLGALGWRDDHVLLLTDADATRENLEQAIAWLARNTDRDSLAVFHYSGHTKQWHGQDPDRDGEVTDEGLWPADNRWMVDREFVARMAAVRAGRLWIDIGGCESAGYADPGLSGPGRLLTFSSAEDEKSYEDPAVANSVWGYFLVQRALWDGAGDTNGDGVVTVEEAAAWAAPAAAHRTAEQSHGPQHAVVIDELPGDLDLRIPPPPEPASDPPASDPPPEGDDDGGGDCLLVCREVRRSRAR